MFRFVKIHTSKIVNLILYSSVIILTLLFANVTYNTREPYRDSGVFLYIGQSILKGDIPYRDLWDHKPPLVYYINAFTLSISDKGLWGLWITEFFFLLVSSILLFTILKRVFGKFTAFVGLLFFLFIYKHLAGGGNFSEEYLFVFQFALIYIALFSKASRLKDFLIGFISSLVILLKINAFGIPLAVIALRIFELTGSKRLNEVGKSCINISLGFILLPVLFLCYLWKNGAILDFYDQVIKYNLIYSATSFAQKIEVLKNIINSFPLLPLIVLPSYLLVLSPFAKDHGRKPVDESEEFFASEGFFSRRCEGRRYPERKLEGDSSSRFKKKSNKEIQRFRLNLILVIAFPIDFLISGFSGKFFPHYGMVLIPEFSFLFAYLFWFAIEYFSSKKSPLRLPKIVISFLICVLLFFVYLQNIDEFLSKSYEKRLFTKEFIPRTFWINNFEVHKNTLDFIENNSESNDKILIWGSESGIYVLSNRESASKYSYQYPLFAADYANNKMAENFVSEIRNNKPKIIIDAARSTFDFQKNGVYTIMPPIDIEGRKLWNPAGRKLENAKELESFYDFVDSHYNYIETTYEDKWRAYLRID